MGYCYGRLAPEPTPLRLRLADYTGAPTWTPPDAASRVGSIRDWGEMLNKRLGVCTLAAYGHLEMALSALALGTPIVIPDSTIQSAYTLLGGYNPATGANDNGLQCTTVLEYGRTTGLGGRKIAAYAAIDLGDQVRAQQGVYEFGGLYVGMRVPQSAEQQTQAGLAWTVPWFSPIVGMHCVPIIAYSPDWLWCVTWGQLQAMTWDFWRWAIDEQYVAIYDDWLDPRRYGQSPTGKDLGQLQYDQARLAA